jgi:SAM-dependent methyltransferase
MDLTHRCRHCRSPLEATLVDLGKSPLCQTFLTSAQLDEVEPFYPLLVYVCDNCWLVQVDEYVSPGQLFANYEYYSSYSTSWLEHARKYVDMAIDRFDLTQDSRIMEIASNDGYLLQYFVQRGIPVLGIDPSSKIASVAEGRGVTTRLEFFDGALADKLVAEGYRSDLIIGNNVLVKIPELNDFVEGVAQVLANDGVATFEVQHLVSVLEHNAFDTIYHEHFNYFSFTAAKRIFAAAGLIIYAVEKLKSHGGSLRLFVRHEHDGSKPVQPSVESLLEEERSFGITDVATYAAFGENVEATKRELLSLLIGAKNDGKRIAIYGASGKGNTLLNYCGIGTDFVDYVVDRNPHRHGRYTPGTHIPIHTPERIAETKPDFVLITPWNLKDEIMGQLDYIRDWDGQFIVPIPKATVVSGGEV